MVKHYLESYSNFIADFMPFWRFEHTYYFVFVFDDSISINLNALLAIPQSEMISPITDIHFQFTIPQSLSDPHLF